MDFVSLQKDFYTMDKENRELWNVINAAIKSKIDIGQVTSLNDLYMEKKKNLHLSNRQILHILGMDSNTLNPILKGTAKHIGFINIIKLAHFLGISVNDLLKIYIPEMDAKQIGEIQRARDAGYIVETFDVATLTKIKFFSSDSSSKDMGEKIKKFFSLNSLYDYSNNKDLTPAFSRSKRSSSDLMRNFWIQSAYVQFKGINNPNPYNRKDLVEIMPKIRPYTRDVKKGLIKVLKALYHVGVTVIYQPSLEKIQVRGATMVINNKPCIVLSNLQNNYPTLWFTLLHELHHVLYDLDDIRLQTYALALASVISFLANMGMNAMWWGGGRRDDRDNGNAGQVIMLLLSVLAIILGPLAASMAQMALSRNREYLADASAVELTSSPLGIISPT